VNRLIALWAHPRSRSTALERVFIERGDFDVFHEPFARMAFDERSAIPFDDLSGGAPDTYESIKAMLRNARERRHVFHKDMCYHCVDALKADDAFLLEQQHVFIIREPARAILSHYAIFPDMPLQAIGHRALYEIFCRVTRLTGKTPHVINADELALRPEATVRALCDYLQLEFLPDAMQWAPDCPSQWLPWRSWHQDAEASTCITALHTSGFDETQLRSHPRLAEYFAVHQPFYERMNQFAHRE
jgi:hypothetical protein